MTSTPGTYTVTYSFTAGTCSNTTTTSITINALPTATINYAGSPYCATGTATVTQTGTAGGTYTAPAGVSLKQQQEILILRQVHRAHILLHTFTSGHVAIRQLHASQSMHFPTATIAYAGSPYCATGTATVTQTGTAGGTYTAPAGL